MSEVPKIGNSREATDLLVLVSYRFMRYKISPWREEAVMISALHSDDILPEAVKRLDPMRFYNYEIVGYLPKNGKRVY